jgi:hypothetical protein
LIRGLSVNAVQSVFCKIIKHIAAAGAGRKNRKIAGQTRNLFRYLKGYEQ